MAMVRYDNERLWLERRRRGLTQEEVATRARCTRLTVHRVERGRNASPGMVRRICLAVGASPDVVIYSSIR